MGGLFGDGSGDAYGIFTRALIEDPGAALYRFDGTDWTPLATSSDEFLAAGLTVVAGAAYLPGDTIIRAELGAEFEAMPDVPSGAYDGVGGLGPDRLWAAEYSGEILHYDGRAWTTIGRFEDEFVEFLAVQDEVYFISTHQFGRVTATEVEIIQQMEVSAVQGAGRRLQGGDLPLGRRFQPRGLSLRWPTSVRLRRGRVSPVLAPRAIGPQEPSARSTSGSSHDSISWGVEGLMGRAITVGLATAALLVAAGRPAAAQTFQGGAGFFIGVRLGAQEPAFEWGGELFATHLFQGGGACTPLQRTGLGALFQFAVAGLSDPRFTLAAHGGGEVQNDSIPALVLDGELGATWFPTGPRWALHTGLLFEVAPFINLSVRHQLFQRTTSLSAGFRYLPTFGMPSSCIAD